MVTKIEWTNETWNPIVGCSKVSPGCDNCYAEKMARRQVGIARAKGQKTYKYYGTVDDNGRWTGLIGADNKVLVEPLLWKKPRMVFVSSMGDLFHKNVSFLWVDAVINIVNGCPQHIFQILTKRPERMVRYFTINPDKVFKNLWLGVTIENQEMANLRIPILLGLKDKFPGLITFVSFEPVIERIDHSLRSADIKCTNCDWMGYTDLDTPEGGLKKMYKGEEGWDNFGEVDDPDDEGWWVCPNCGLKESNGIMSTFDGGEERLDWVIVGGETGPGARAMKLEWVEKIVADCKAANVPCFVKKLPVNGKVTGDMSLWPEHLQIRQWPEVMRS